MTQTKPVHRMPITARTVTIRRRRFNPYRSDDRAGIDADRPCREDDNTGDGSFSSSSLVYVAHFDEARRGDPEGETAVTDVEGDEEAGDMSAPVDSDDKDSRVECGMVYVC